MAAPAALPAAATHVQPVSHEATIFRKRCSSSRQQPDALAVIMSKAAAEAKKRCTQQQYDDLAGILSAAAAEAKKAIGQGAPELVLTVEAYTELTKQMACNELQVGRILQQCLQHH
jgi:hypothetical protein